MVHGVSAPGLAARPYFHRYTEDAVDLCDVLASFSSQAKATLYELCRVMGLPGKPNGMTGAEVEKYNRDGHIREIAEYCESDVLNTYRVWLRHELFRGRLSHAEFQASEANLADFVKARGNTKPHLHPNRTSPTTAILHHWFVEGVAAPLPTARCLGSHLLKKLAAQVRSAGVRRSTGSSPPDENANYSARNVREFILGQF